MSHRMHLLAVLSLILLVLASTLEANDLQQQRLQRWGSQSVSRVQHSGENVGIGDVASGLSKSSAAAVVDIKINSDDGAATFRQRLSDVVFFSDGKGVAVWEDERNGVWEIYAQLLTADGLPTGANIRLINDANYRSARQPRLAVNSANKLAIVWTEGETGSIHAKIFSSGLAALTGKVKLNDNTGTSTVNLPSVATLATGGFVAVWEDSRDGADIVGQIFGDGANRIGDNFRVNSSATSPYRIAPDVAASNDTTFAVVWEDARSGSAHSYFRIMKNDGTALYSELTLESNYPAAYQFNPQVEFCKGNGYYASWISDRHSGQSVYGQKITSASEPVDTSIRINASSADVCWDLRTTAAGDSGLGVVWSDYTSTAQIKYQKMTKLGALSGENVAVQDASLLGERSFPTIGYRSSGANVIWTDDRQGNADIYQQRIDAATSKTLANQMLNDDAAGSQQHTPDIAWLPQGASVVVWKDCRTDAGDIMLQRTKVTGGLLGSVMRINDDPGRSLQANPCIGTSTAGDMVVVWEDNRSTTGISGQNIFMQRLWPNGTKVGENTVVNDDGTSNPKSDPDVAVGNDGSCVIVWIDQRNSKKQIYMQRYNSSGATVGVNQLVAEVLGADESFAPRVGVRGDGSFVVTYLAIVNGRQEMFFQRYNSAGTTTGNSQMLDVDSSQVQVLDGDIFVHDYKGDFYIASIQMTASGDVVKWHRYGFDGNVKLSNSQISDVTGVGFADLKTDGDIDDGIVATWTDSRSGISRGYFQLLREDGYHLGINTPVSTATTAYLEKHPAVSLNNGFVFCTWIDNRNLGRGFDLFLNFDQYTATVVDDNDGSLPKTFSLEQNFPNPFNPETVINYELRSAQPVVLMVYNTLGQHVRTLVDEFQTAGTHSVVWDGRSAANVPVASGIYFYRLKAGEFTDTRKMTLLK